MLMAMTLSKATQETAVGEGLALGCVALEVDAVEGSKMDLEFAFRRAWRSWPYHSTFAVVRADVARDDLLRILGKSEGRRSALPARCSLRSPRSRSYTETGSSCGRTVPSTCSLSTAVGRARATRPRSSPIRAYARADL